MRAHLLRIHKPGGTAENRALLLGARGFKQTISPRLEPKLEEEPALRHRAVSFETETFRDPPELCKIDMRCEVGASGIGKRIGIAMPADGLQRVAEP